MRTVDLGKLRTQYQGTRICELVGQHLNHLRQQSNSDRTKGLQGTIELIPVEARGIIEQFIDDWNAPVYDQSFWQRETTGVFDEIIEAARQKLRPFGLADDDQVAFNLFHIVVLNYAMSAYGQPKMQEFMQLSGSRFPWWSAGALLYPTIGVVNFAMTTPAGPLEITGYGVTTLAYTLLAAGVLPAGTFRVLGLRRRLHVFAAGICAFAIGIALVNIRL